MKIYRINVLLNMTGVKQTIYEYECKKMAKSFMVNTPSGFGGTTTRVKKEDILKVDSMVRDGLFNCLQRFTWYFEGHEKQAKEKVYESLLNTASNQAAIANQILQHISKL